MTFLTFKHSVLPVIISGIVQKPCRLRPEKALVRSLQFRDETEEKGSKMKLINNKEFLRNAANYIDVMNTLGGGIVQTNVAYEQRKKGAIIRIQAPTITEEAYRVHILNNQLTVSALMPQKESTNWVAPIFHQEFALPLNVALDRIKVVYKNGELQIRLPFVETTGRQLSIETEEED